MSEVVVVCTVFGLIAAFGFAWALFKTWLERRELRREIERYCAEVHAGRQSDFLERDLRRLLAEKETLWQLRYGKLPRRLVDFCEEKESA